MSLSRRRLLALSAAAVPMSLAWRGADAAAGPVKPPVAAVQPVVDDYFGVKITDPYRWMEDRTAPQFVTWAKAETAYARQTLDAIPGRDALQARIAKRTGGGVALGGLKLAGGKVFSLQRHPGENSFRLYVREGLDGPERVLVDPDTIPTTGPHYAIDYFEPSPNGAKVAVGLSPGGSENSVIHVIDVATGAGAAETIDRTEDGSPSWLPDSSGFFYNRFVLLGTGAKETDKYQNSRALLHKLGTDPEADIPLIGTGVAGSPSVTPVDSPFIATVGDCPYAFGVISHGADPDMTLYVSPLAAAVAGKPQWRKVADVEDKVSNLTAVGDRLFLLSHKGAPRFQVLEAGLAAPNVAGAKVIAPESGRVIQDFSIAADALYIRDLDGGLGKLRRYDLKTGVLTEVALPAKGTLTGPFADPASPTVVFLMQNWVTAPTAYALTGESVTHTSLIPPWNDDLSPYVAEEVMATAADGVKIPLSIIYRKGLKRDGKNPVWLTGYGAYGVSLMPTLASRFLTLLDDGGVYAVAHVRGGGEFGEDWHLAGKQATKPNTYRDLIACAEYLVAQGYGSPATLAIEGRSAGGITVGMALTQRPDLFRVAFVGVGDCNTLRCENGTDGPANALEYGSVATKAGFEPLLAVDSTQHVVPGGKYPAVLLTSGMNDPRVAPWQPGKMAAHLQAKSASGRPVIMLIDFDAGHGMGSTKAQRDKELADQTAFFYWQIGRVKAA